MRGMPDRQFKIAIPEMSLSRIESMQLEDMDGDNKKDLMLLMSSFVKRTEFQFLKGKGALRFAPAVRIALETSLNPKDSSGMNSLMRIVDFNLDRNPDVLIGSVQHSQSKSFVQFVLPNRLANRFGVRLHGKAVAGSGAVIPKITRVGGHSDIGNKYFGISLSYVPGDKTQVVLMMSARLTPITTPWFTIQVFPIFSFGAETKGTGVGEGHVVLPFPIPKFKDLLGKTYYFQWLIADPGAKNPAGLSMTQALATTLTQN